MGEVNTNTTSWQIAEEASFGVLGGSPVWRKVEVNDVSSFAINKSTVMRDPISNDRQNRKSILTDIDASPAFDMDITISHADNLMDYFMFSTSTNRDLDFEGGNTTGTGYTTAAIIAAQANKLLYTLGGPISLVHARGYANTENNGLKELGDKPIATDTELTVSGLVAETAPSNAVVQIAGIRPETGDLAITVSGDEATITSGNNAAVNNIDFTLLGLTVGQAVHVGGLLSANQFSAGAGYGFIKSIAAGTLVLDRIDSTLATDPGAAETVDLLFGKFVRNVAVDHADFKESSLQIEGGFPNLETGGATMYEYAIGNYANEMTLTIPTAEKATMSVGFVGKDIEVPTTTRKTNAATAIDTVSTSGFGTSANIAKLRVATLANSALSTCITSFNVTINNGVTAQKCIGVTGANSMNLANFIVTGDIEMVLSNDAVISSLRNNDTVNLYGGLDNDDGAVFFDIPAATLGGGEKSFTKNEKVSISVNGEAFKDPVLGYTASLSLIPIVPQ